MRCSTGEALLPFQTEISSTASEVPGGVLPVLFPSLMGIL